MSLIAKLKGLFSKPATMVCDNCGETFAAHPQGTIEMHLKLRGDLPAPQEVLDHVRRSTGISDDEVARLADGEDVVLYKFACARCQLRMFLMNIREGRAV